MKKSGKTEYEQLQQQKMREQTILESMQKSNENGTPYEYTEEQMLNAQEQPAKEEINKLFSDKIFPANNGVLYLVYYIFSLIIIPLLYINEEEYKSKVGIGAWMLLIVMLIVLKCTEKLYQREMGKQYKVIECINNFANDTSIYCYILTSLGYFAGFLGAWEFAIIYGAMLFVFIIGFYYKIIKPLWHSMRSHKIS